MLYLPLSASSARNPVALSDHTENKFCKLQKEREREKKKRKRKKSRDILCIYSASHSHDSFDSCSTDGAPQIFALLIIQVISLRIGPKTQKGRCISYSYFVGAKVLHSGGNVVELEWLMWASMQPGAALRAAPQLFLSLAHIFFLSLPLLFLLFFIVCMQSDYRKTLCYLITLNLYSCKLITSFGTRLTWSDR